MPKSDSIGHRPILRKLVGAFAWAAAVVIILTGASQIRLDVNPLRILPQNLPEVQGLSAFLERFSRPDELILAIDGPDAATVEATSQALTGFLRTRPDLASAVVDRPPGEEDPAAMADLVAHLLIHQDPARLEELTSDLAPGKSSARIENTLERMTYDLSPAVALLGAYDPLRLVEAAFGTEGGSPSGGAKFGSDDGQLKLIYLWAAEPLARQDYLKLIAWTSKVRAAILDWREATACPPEVRIRLTGEPAIMSEVSAGMQRDMMGSGFSTSLLVALIFWGVYRRITPLWAILSIVSLVALLTFGVSGWLVGDLNAMNAGFGAILIGLTVDYAILIHQKSLVHRGDARATRGAVRMGIFGASTTTAASFAVLNASSQPSLAALGSIVVIGTLLAATLMLWLFVPWISRLSVQAPAAAEPPPWLCLQGTPSRVLALLTALSIPAAAAVVMWKGAPAIDGTDRATRPRVSEGYEALDDLQRSLTGQESAASLVVHADSALQLRERLQALQAPLQDAVESGQLRSFFSPERFVPVASFRASNESSLTQLRQAEPRLMAELLETGFEPESAMLLEEVVKRLPQPGQEAATLSDSARWMLQRLVNLDADDSAWATVPIDTPPDADLSALTSEHVLLADWDATTRAMRQHTPREFARIFTWLLGLICVLLTVTFRRPQEILWVALSLCLSSLLTLAVMSLAGWNWNFVNAAALMICLGAGSDYSIHMLLAMRRGETIPQALRGTGQAMVVCALTSVAGFGSLGFASNLGLASLGQVCALALAANCLVATQLLPRLWFLVHGRKSLPLPS